MSSRDPVTLGSQMQMVADEVFASFIARLQEGDPFAANELVRDYESLVRRGVRVALRDSRARRVFDSSDVCQSAFAKFFLLASSRSFSITSPEHLLRLLVSIAQKASHWLYSPTRGPAGQYIYGDVNGDGVVNGLDIALIASNWLHHDSSASAASAVATVPEPATGVLALMAAGVTLLACRKSRSGAFVWHASSRSVACANNII